ncbi:MAG TPA: murein biosynthesis integral membrane protein MurJ [Patescibacteria group bacterium]|nr:murein biosynthesis integral membrane protein MurJ [Patescibacteria group bacterium]
MSTNKSIIRSAGVIGVATLCSRLLGFIRDIVIARLFGVYLYAQAFVVAFKIPNLFRDLVAEGAANAAFVPVFSEYSVKHSKEEFWQLAGVVLNLLVVILMAITILGIAFSPLIVRLIAPGFISDPQKLATTVTLNRIIFPYILLISLAVYATALLNSLKYFTIPAFAPCLLNASIIVCALLFGEGVQGLAWGVLAGGVLQLAVQIPSLYRRGFRLKLAIDLRHPELKSISRLMLPRLFSSGIYQLNNFVDSIFGSLAFVVGEGGVAVLYFAYRLIQFPLGIFSNALSQAILPTFSTQALEPGQEDLKRTLSFGLRAVFFVMLPASAGFMTLAQPIVRTLFGGGKFDAYSVEATANVLLFYSLGLCFYGATKVVQSCFFALKDSLTPAKVSVISLGMNVALNTALMFPMKVAGLALATSISGIVTFLILAFMLDGKLKGFDLRPVVAAFGRILAASIGMGLVCSYFSRHNIFPGNDIATRVLNLVLAIGAGLASYGIFCVLFRVKELKELWQWLVRRG